MNVKYLINRAIKEFPDNIAIICEDERRIFSELNARVNCVGNGLLELGLNKGDRVGMLLPNCCQFIEIDFALSKTGFVRVPLNARLTAEEHSYMLNDSGSNTLIFAQRFSEIVQSIKRDLTTIGRYIQIAEGASPRVFPNAIDYEDLIKTSKFEDPEIEIDELDLHTLFYTSGTTGKPKGVMITQKSWANVAINLLLDYGPNTERDKILNLQPLSHGAGFFVLPFFIKGATNILIPKFDPELVFETIEKHQVTILKLVPTMLCQLLDYPNKHRFDLSRLRSIIYGGSPIAVPRLTEAIRFFGKKLVQLYGQAETPMCITTLSKEDHVIEGPEEVVKRLNSAGKPLTNVEVRVVDEDGKDAQPSEVGEVIVRGDHIMQGYWNRPEETAQVLKEGWVYTGDLGYTDTKGYIFLVDRKKDMIISGGFNIYPKEIEDVVISHPKVEEVAVIGVPDERWGERITAVVKLKAGEEMTGDELLQWCKERFPAYNRPRQIEFGEIPKSPTNKTLKHELRLKYGGKESAF